MTRLSVPSEDVLGENYKITNITSSNYNPTIDSTITVTITVKDVYGDEIEDEYVTITCNVGKFTKLNGSTITDTQSVTAQTDNDGEISLTYTCSEWGLITFSANTKSCQVHVSGWRYVEGTSTSTWAIRRNQDTAQLILKAYQKGSIITSTEWNDFGGGTAYASALKPPTYKLGFNSEGTLYIRANSDGSFSIRALTGTISGSTNLYGVLEWSF